MSLEQIHVLEEVASLEELSEQLARLQRTIRYLLNGNLDFTNIRAKGIIAETIDVNQLSAISADLGEINAGIIRGIEIYGSKIATREAGYPRVVLSDTTDAIIIEYSASRRIVIDANNYISNLFPHLRFVSDGYGSQIHHGGTSGLIFSGDDVTFQSNLDIFTGYKIWISTLSALQVGSTNLSAILNNYVQEYDYNLKISDIESRLDALESL